MLAVLCPFTNQSRSCFSKGKIAIAMHGAGARPQHATTIATLIIRRARHRAGRLFCRAACSFLVRRDSSDKGNRFIGKLLFPGVIGSLRRAN